MKEVVLVRDVLIEGEIIKEISKQIEDFPQNTTIIDARGKYLIPGVIDDQVHFREPGLTHKANIASESEQLWQEELPLLLKCQIRCLRQPLKNCLKISFK